MIRDDNFLTVDMVLDKLRNALKKREPFSLVRVGDGENLILAQDTVMTIEEVLQVGWSRKANSGKKGVTLPNLDLRDQMVHSIQNASVVGIPFEKDALIRVNKRLKRELTDKLFAYYQINPTLVCHTFITRVLPQKQEFWNLLKGKRLLIISRWAVKLQEKLQQKPYNLHVNLTIPFHRYDQMRDTLKKVYEKQNEFDIALVSCGVNAVVLAQQIAEQTGKIGLDFGKSASYMVKNLAGLENNSSRANLDMLP